MRRIWASVLTKRGFRHPSRSPLSLKMVFTSPRKPQINRSSSQTHRPEELLNRHHRQLSLEQFNGLGVSEHMRVVQIPGELCWFSNLVKHLPHVPMIELKQPSPHLRGFRKVVDNLPHWRRGHGDPARLALFFGVLPLEGWKPYHMLAEVKVCPVVHFEDFPEPCPCVPEHEKDQPVPSPGPASSRGVGLAVPGPEAPHEGFELHLGKVPDVSITVRKRDLKDASPRS